MTGYEYGNARLHAMKSRLLSKREFEGMIQTSSLQGFIAQLAKTTYRGSVEAALARTSGIDCVTEALHIELTKTIGKLSTFYRGQPGKLVALLLRIYDIHNLKTILRGLSRNIPAGEVLPALIPVGELKYSLLVELANVKDARDAMDMLASLLLPHARPLLHLRQVHPGASEFEMELTLDRWYFDDSHKFLKKNYKGKGWVAAFFQLEADLINMLTCLRFAHMPAERAFLAGFLDKGKHNSLFIRPGKLPLGLLEQAVAQDSVTAAVELLGRLPYEAPLRSGMEKYNRNGRLSEFEKALRRFRLEWLVPLIQKDPLGIGVVLGFMALKINEINNLTWIAHSINIGLDADAIGKEVEWIE
jgi:V/A-type H+/Na+-transporting ATPase subunit C